jgi:hypothetical protein
VLCEVVVCTLLSVLVWSEPSLLILKLVSPLSTKNHMLRSSSLRLNCASDMQQIAINDKPTFSDRSL